MASEDSLKTGATVGMAREPSISRWNLVQNSEVLLVQEDTGLPLTRLESGRRGREGAAWRRYLLLCYYTGLCTADASGFFWFLSGAQLNFLRTLMLQYNKSLQALT